MTTDLPLPTVGVPGGGVSGDRDPNARLELEGMVSDPEAPRLTAEQVARLETDAQAILGRYPQSRSALLPMLHLMQAEQGYVTPDGIELCARILGLTPAEVNAVATFYTMYKRHPQGEYAVGVCTNTLCAVMGGDAIYSRLKEHLGVGHDETTSDGKVTLEHLECNAACDYAPVVMVNWEFFDNQTPESAVALVDALRAGTPPQPERGATLRPMRETSRVLAGFYDGRADEGAAAGHATLAGCRVARGETAVRPGAGTGPGSSSSAGEILDGAVHGYGAPNPDGGPAGPSGSDAPLSTAASDPANPAPSGAAAETEGTAVTSDRARQDSRTDSTSSDGRDDS